MKRFKKINLIVGKIVLLFLVSYSLISCEDDNDKHRGDYLLVLDTLDETDSTTFKIDNTAKLYCDINGGLDTLYVFSNVEYDIIYQTKDEEWARIISEEYLEEINGTRVIIEVEPMLDSDYRRRTGSLIFSNKEKFLGYFVDVIQGFNTRLDEDFTWLRYGSANPIEIQNETSIANWSVLEKEKGWTASVNEEDGIVNTYGKNGYIKLGSELSGGNIITPYLTSIARDSAFLVSLNAIAYSSVVNEKDNNQLTVNILSGGEFLDGKTSNTFNLNYYNSSDDDLATNMWNDSAIDFYVRTNIDNPISGTTRFQFVSNGRVFIDNVSIYVLNKEYYYLVR